MPGWPTCAPRSPRWHRRPTSPTAPRVHRHGRRGDAQPRLRPSAVPAGRPPAGRLAAGGSGEGGRIDMAEATDEESTRRSRAGGRRHRRTGERGKTVHGEAANAGHRVLAPDDAEVEAYLETALNAPAAGSADRRPTAGRRPDTGRRPRLRQPVRPADRAPRPRAQRLLGAAAARHAVGRDRAPRRPRRSSCRAARTRSTTTTRRKPDPAIWTRPDPGPRHLLRRPADGPRARRRRRCRPTKREYGPATVTITDGRRPVRAASTASSRSG